MIITNPIIVNPKKKIRQMRHFRVSQLTYFFALKTIELVIIVVIEFET